jgi:hypothetical protein
MSASLLRKMAERERVAARLASLDRDISAACRAWSDDRGYRVPLRPEQVRRALEPLASRAAAAEGLAS